MDEMVRLFVLAQGEFGERVAAVPADQWERPIVASAWTIGDLVDHLTEENRWVAPLLAGQSLEQAGDTVAKLSAEVDRQQAWRTAAAASAQAFAEPGALERSVALSRGATPASLYITEAVFDHTVHCRRISSPPCTRSCSRSETSRSCIPACSTRPSPCPAMPR
jgi:uncharacterized protein (TIGR03086 family)